ncbi:MAG: hypothetical protein WB777_00110, partial [Mycobacterium sp.]
PQPEAVRAADWRALLTFGTVLDDGEELTSERVADAAGPGVVVMYHAVYERAARPPSIACPAAASGVRRSRRTPRPNGISPSMKGTS